MNAKSLGRKVIILITPLYIRTFIITLFLGLAVFQASCENLIEFPKGSIKIYIPSGTVCKPVNWAIKDLNRDIEKITGSKAQVIRISNVSQIASGNSIVLLNESDASFSMPVVCQGKTNGWESHRVYEDAGKIYLQGADTRGLIYAIYTFSEKVLGIPPLWYWAMREPEKKTTVEVPVGMDYFFDTPDVKYRAWFPNDQDMFNPWKSGREDRRQAWFESMLRLKLNAIEYGCPIFYPTANTTARLYSEADSIKSRGFVLSYTHTVALGTHFSSWDNYWQRIKKMTTSPELSMANENLMFEFWEHAATTMHQSGAENIWQIAFRGSGDVPFWETIPDAPTSDAARAATIQRMWEKQLEILKRVTGNPKPLVKLTMYNEISDFMAAGLLTPPEGENIIWSYVATRRDHYPADDVLQHNSLSPVKMGYYMNLQFTSSGAHLAQAEGPWKMEQNFRVVNDKSPLYYSVINVGNLREFLFTMSANTDMMWNMNTYNTDDFLLSFCKTYFGEEHASVVADLYKDFFNAYWKQRNPEFTYKGVLMDRQFVYQDLRYKQSIMTLRSAFSKKTYDPNPLYRLEERHYNIVPTDHGVNTQVEAVIKCMPTVRDDFMAVANATDVLSSQLPEAYRPFLLSNLQSQAHFMAEISEMFYQYILTYQQYYINKNIAATHVAKSLKAANRARDYLYQNQQGEFSEWYSGDTIDGKFNLKTTIQKIEEVKKMLPTTGIDHLEIEKIQMAVRDGYIFVDQLPENAILSVYNMFGQKCMERKVTVNNSGIPHQLPKGMYIFVIHIGNQSINQKIII